MKTLLVILVALVVLPPASAQWSDPGGTWPGAQLAPTQSVEPSPSATVEPESQVVSEVDTRSPTPDNPFNGLPPGVTVIPRGGFSNPYNDLPAGAIAPDRPGIPCSRWRPDHCAPGEEPIF